jgi:hypothetical protein
MGDAAKTAGSQKKHLIFESVRAQRPAVAEDDGLAHPPILEIDLCSVFGRECVHMFSSFVSMLVFDPRRWRVRSLRFSGERRRRETDDGRKSRAVDEKSSTRHTGS